MVKLVDWKRLLKQIKDNEGIMRNLSGSYKPQLKREVGSQITTGFKKIDLLAKNFKRKINAKEPLGLRIEQSEKKNNSVDGYPSQ